MQRFTGTWTALITPFRDGKLDLPCLRRLVERQIEGGVDGLVPCGTTGESPTLSDDEHDAVVATTVETARGRVPVLAGAGSNSTAKAVALAQRAEKLGAAGVLVVSPYYNKPNQRGLAAHFGAVAENTALPVVLYNIPGRCGVLIENATIRDLFERHKNIVAVKHATGGVADAVELHAQCAIDILSGDDPITWPLMSIGAVGVVSVLSNLAPGAVVRITRAARSGDWAAAQAAHEAAYPLARALLSLDTNPTPIKTALAERGLCQAEFRLPLVPLDEAQRATLLRLLAEHPLA